MNPLTTGNTIPELKLHTLKGEEHYIHTENGHFLLMSFWSMRCFSCMKAAKELKELHEKYAGRLEIVGINMDTELNMWEQGSNRDAISWTNLSDMKGTDEGIGQQFGITGFPAYALIDPAGLIVDRWMGYKPGRIEEKVLEHLAG